MNNTVNKYIYEFVVTMSNNRGLEYIRLLGYTEKLKKKDGYPRFFVCNNNKNHEIHSYLVVFFTLESFFF